MLCPYCQAEVDEKWQSLHFIDNNQTSGVSQLPSQLQIQRQVEPDPPVLEVHTTRVTWMRCPNEKCWKPLLRIWAQAIRSGMVVQQRVTVEDFIALPRWPSDRTVSEDVPDDYRKAFLEAAAILERSAQGSAAISRRLLADILTEQGFAGQELSKQIDAFMADSSAPAFLKPNLDHVREVGNFAVHTQKSTNTGEVIPVEPGEAEWMLEVLDTMFQHYYVAPAKASQQRAAMDAKILEAGRRPADQ